MFYYDYRGERSAYDMFTEFEDGTVSSYRFINLHREVNRSIPTLVL